MTKIVKGGAVRRRAEKDLYAVPVESVTFPDIPQPQPPAAGDMATIVVQRVPATPYVKGEALFYWDGNHHNDTNFAVTSVVGPAKYKVVVT